MKYVMFSVLLLAAVSESPRAEGTGGPLRVELDAFSGVRNPVWTLKDHQAEEFLARVKVLKADDSKRAIHAGLGYRGFIVTGYRGYETLTVWGGIVQGDGDGKTARWHDEGRGLEKFLLSTAKDHVSETVYKRVESEVNKP